MKIGSGPTVTQYWLGTPCKYHPDRKDLDGFPEGDLGGREIALPDSTTPQQLYSDTIVEVQALHQEAQRRFASGQGNGKLHPFGVLSQGIYMVWIFASMQMTKLYEMLVIDRQEIARLQSRVEKLEALVLASDSDKQ